MRFALKRARRQVAEKNVDEGDVVVVLFNFYTGNTDFVEGGPFGSIPGGLLVSTVAAATDDGDAVGEGDGDLNDNGRLEFAIAYAAINTHIEDAKTDAMKMLKSWQIACDVKQIRIEAKHDFDKFVVLL